MASISPKKVQDEAFEILNRVIAERRSISEFENEKVIRCIDSLYKEKNPAYDQISACYFSQISDIDNLLVSVSNIFERREEFSYNNIIYALNNAMRYAEAYKYIKEFNISHDDSDFLETAIKACSFSADMELANIYIDKYLSLYSKIDNPDVNNKINEFNEFNNFLIKNKKIKNEISSYLLECFDVFSRNTLSKTREIDSAYGYSHHVFNDEGYDFIAFSFVLNGSADDIDYIIDIEDEFTCEISKIECNPAVRTKIAFNFELGELS